MTSQQLDHKSCIFFLVGKIPVLISGICFVLTRRFPWPLSCPLDGVFLNTSEFVLISLLQLLMKMEFTLKQFAENTSLAMSQHVGARTFISDAVLLCEIGAWDCIF